MRSSLKVPNIARRKYCEMIIASFSSPDVPWYISEGIFALLAGLGGMVVSRGLTMEGPPKDGTPREIQGWKLLRFGFGWR